MVKEDEIVSERWAEGLHYFTKSTDFGLALSTLGKMGYLGRMSFKKYNNGGILKMALMLCC